MFPDQQYIYIGVTLLQTVKCLPGLSETRGQLWEGDSLETNIYKEDRRIFS